MKKYAIMMVGKTHSGKTTFGSELERKIQSAVVIQTDPVSLFLTENFNKDLDPDKEHDGSFKKPSLKYKIFKIIFEHVVGERIFTPILANANMHQKLRKESIEYLQKNGYKVIGVYMNFSEDFLLNRIIKAKRSAKVLTVSKGFSEVLVKQRDWFVCPKKEEFDYFFEIQDEKEIESIQNEIRNLIAKNTS